MLDYTPEKFDREAEIEAFLINNDIPQKFIPCLQAIILMAAFEPECSVPAALERYAEQNQISLRRTKFIVQHAINLGWENATTPSSLLLTNRMTSDAFLKHAVFWIQSKEKAFNRRR